MAGFESRALFIALANSRQYGGHGCIAPRAVLDDGRLNLVVVDDLPLWRVVARVPGFFRGTLQPGGGVAMHSFQRARVATPQRWELHLDGEPSAGSEVLDVQVHPRSLTVVVPPNSTTPTAASHS